MHCFGDKFCQQEDWFLKPRHCQPGPAKYCVQVLPPSIACGCRHPWRAFHLNAQVVHSAKAQIAAAPTREPMLAYPLPDASAQRKPNLLRSEMLAKSSLSYINVDGRPCMRFKLQIVDAPFYTAERRMTQFWQSYHAAGPCEKSRCCVCVMGGTRPASVQVQTPV